MNDSEAVSGARPAGTTIPPRGDGHVYDQITRVLAGETAPLLATPAGTADRPLRIALIVPPFGFGSGGHAVLFGIAAALERLGHSVSTWLHDPFGFNADLLDGAIRQAIADDYVALAGPAYRGFEHWNGADVVLATGWQTVYPAMTLPRCRARAYIVNDHEPEFYPTSLESHFAAQTYRLGLPCLLGGGGWLEQQLVDRYGVTVAGNFPYPVAPEFQPRPIERRGDTIVLYGRNTTPRRAVGLALIALEELVRRRPDTRVIMFGDPDTPETTFPYEHFGPIAPEDLSWIYSEATVGLAFSMTHGSLVPHDMMACGLPVLDIEGYGTGVEHAETDLVELAAFDPFSVADGLERLLDDSALRARRSRDGLTHVAAHTWERSGALVETALRGILREREAATAAVEVR
ncbi:MAG: glycosyltransferase family 4 protein [Solirubrobacteraceae bacterium]|nr:glycosyltransferase family 4 protein [Solirubrobacteraceae bacterium]